MAEEEGTATLEEMEANLASYKEQLAQVEALLSSEPENAEYVDLKESLTEVITLTEDLVKTAVEEQQAAGSAAAQGAGVSSLDVNATYGGAAAAAPAAAAPDLVNPVFSQLGQWMSGAECEVTLDGGISWLDAVIVGIQPSGLIKCFLKQNRQREMEVQVAQIRQKEVAPVEETHEVYKGVPAPKRLKAENTKEYVPTEMPKKLQIHDEDDDHTREKKRKQIKQWKGRQRAAELDAEQNKQANSWQNFKAKVSNKKKPTGAMSSFKKQSMFAVPEGLNSKVGVIGSGKGLTDFTGKKRNEFERD